jgi:hypothetical protein
VEGHDLVGRIRAAVGQARRTVSGARADGQTAADEGPDEPPSRDGFSH